MKSRSVHDGLASVLIVSADSPLDQTLTSTFKEQGYTIELAITLQEGIRKASENCYDTILLDIDSNIWIDAQETWTSATLQSLIQKFPDIPLICTVTPQTESQQKFELIKSGAFDLLAKPYQCHELKVIIQRALVAKHLMGQADQMSLKLIASEEHFKAVVQASPDAIVLGDEGGNILSWNEAAKKMFGYTCEEIIGQSLTLLMPSRYHQAHQEGIARVRTTHKTTVIGHTVELAGLRKGGREFPIELSLSYSLVENQYFYCGIIRDLTPHKEAEKALQESEDRFQLTIEHINDAVFYGDLSGRVLWANSQASKLVGRPLETIIGHPLMECLSPEAAHIAESRLALVREGFVIPPQVEFEVLRPDGTSRLIEANVTSVIRHGQVMGRLLVGRDITERKDAEFSLLDRNRMLALDAKVGQIVSRSQDPDTLLQACAETLVRHLDAALARIWILDPREQVLTLKASAGLYTHVNGGHSRIPVGQLKVGQIAAAKRPLLTNAVIGDPRIPDQEWAQREELVAFAGYPLLRGQEVVGVMGMFSKHPFTEFTVNSLEMVGDRITTAVECKMATEANQRLARFNEQILASAGEGIFGIDPEGKTTFVNPAAANMLGYDLQDLQGVAVHSTIHPTNRDGSSCLLDGCSLLTVLKDGVLQQDDREVLCRKNGTSFPVEFTTTPMWEDGQIAGAVVTFKDISDRKRAEETQQRYCQQVGATLAALPGSILVVDKNQQVLYANDRANLNFGRKDFPLIRRHIQEVLPFTSAHWLRVEEEFACRTRTAVEDQQDQEFEVSDRTYSYRLFPISLEGQDDVQTGIVIWDITERKRLQEQLIQSEKLSGLGTLVSGMVHEVRSPMQAIVGYADLIMEEDNALVSKEHAEDLKRVTQHITTVLTDFLTYARPSSNEETMAIDLNERLLEAVTMVQRGPTFGSVIVKQQFTTLPPVSIRQGEIDQVFINLIGNAVQAMEGKGCLTLATFHKDHSVTAKISDTGSGIPKEILRQIFDPFFSTKAKGKGTGMGLSIVQQIVNSYRGQITVESAVGKGTTFTIQFPEHLNP